MKKKKTIREKNAEKLKTFLEKTEKIKQEKNGNSI
tara:strand:+ start:2443 stop:2547 length:105 start_codon:yes stop_codon:yes gene_type:complete